MRATNTSTDISAKLSMFCFRCVYFMYPTFATHRPVSPLCSLGIRAILFYCRLFCTIVMYTVEAYNQISPEPLKKPHVQPEISYQ